MKFPYPHWDTAAWAVVLFAAFALEFLGIFRPADATLTQLIRTVIPTWARAMILGWLCYHFLIQSGK